MYTVNGTILIDGGIKEQSGLHFSANITFHFLTACDGVVYVCNIILPFKISSASQMSYGILKHAQTTLLLTKKLHVWDNNKSNNNKPFCRAIHLQVLNICVMDSRK